MRRKFALPALPNLFFRGDTLSVPGYRFAKARHWDDAGSLTLLAEGVSLKDNTKVLAKIAPATGNASVCLEREAHLLVRLAETPESNGAALQFIDFLSIPRDCGDCVVLLVNHPGLNLLGRYFPPSAVNELLLAGDQPQPLASYNDSTLINFDDEETERYPFEEFDVIDLASFLEFAIQAAHCLQKIHKTGLIHREVRGNAFHMNSHSGLVRFAHFGNRSVSLEHLGGPSPFVIKADSANEQQRKKVKEALCYLAPEQTGSIETAVEDHRTDLYSLGVLLWTLLVGQGIMPFEGSPIEILYAIAQKRPMPVHEVRRDIPQVLALIVEKLLAKNPDGRYNSAYGLKADLVECQKRLLSSVSAASDDSMELIPLFEIGLEDKYMDFTIPVHLFGREKENEVIRNVIKHTSASHIRQHGPLKAMSPWMSRHSSYGLDDQSESNYSVQTSSTDDRVLDGQLDLSPVVTNGRLPADSGSRSSSLSRFSDSSRRLKGSPKTRIARAQSIIVAGPAGVGKSSLILAHQAKWRTHGLWGHAKFQNESSTPFASLLTCLSSVLRQMMIFHSDMRRFSFALQERLGRQIHNVPLLYQGAPELRDVLSLCDVEIKTSTDVLMTDELRARFQYLVEQVFSVLAEVRLLALFLDDLHEADESSLDLMSALANSRSRLLMLGSVRTDDPAKLDRIEAVFSSKTRATWVYLDPLSFSAISSLVSRTLHRNKDETLPLSRFVHRVSGGNAFSAKNTLISLQRHQLINFDWSRNHWRFDISKIEANFVHNSPSETNDMNYLINHLRELPLDARKYITWASLFGPTFKATEVALMMDWEDTSGSSGSEDEPERNWNLSKAVSRLGQASLSTSRGSMRGLQVAISEGWLAHRARDMCSFSHDRYRQAAIAESGDLKEPTLAKMCFRIVLMLMHESPPDAHRVAAYARRCLSVIREHSIRDDVLELLIEAGDSAWIRGAHELAREALLNARALLSEEHWDKNKRRTLAVVLKLAELSTWKGDIQESNALLDEAMEKADEIEDRAKALWFRSRNKFSLKNIRGALDDTLSALEELGVILDPSSFEGDADALFEQFKQELQTIGLNNLLPLSRQMSNKTDLAVQLLNDAAANAYWSGEGIDTDVISLTAARVALRSGVCAGSAVALFWALGASAERRELYAFSTDLGTIALEIAEENGTDMERCRAQVLYCIMVSGYASEHIRANIPRCDAAVKSGLSSGDRTFTGFALIHGLIDRLYCCRHLSELVPAAEEAYNDISVWAPDSILTTLAMGVLNCIRAIGGFTDSRSPSTAFDVDGFSESEFVAHAATSSPPLVMNWYNSFKVVGFFCLGFVQEAAILGFSVYETAHLHPNHRHIRFALCYHSLALIACIRRGSIDANRYLRQIELNQAFIKKWLPTSPINTGTWIALVEAEVASLSDNFGAFKLYDLAVTSASSNNWTLEEGWALYLQGSHFVRCGVEGLGTELQRRGILRQSKWGASGIVNNLTTALGAAASQPINKDCHTSEIGVQTDSSITGHGATAELLETPAKIYGIDEEDVLLTSSDLSAILRWSKDISSDIHLSSALRRLTEIAVEISCAQDACIVIAREAGDYTVSTSMSPPSPCKVHEDHKPIRNLTDPLQRAVIQHSLNTKSRVVISDASIDSRFSSEAHESLYHSIICLPIVSNRGQTFGVMYLASNIPFSQITVHVLTLLLQQASISISNALLFRSVQAGTRENLKMISAQRAALEQARKSREDALKATKIKSNFLASMSHELRTPFSSFYGLLDILNGTDLNHGQREIVQTSMQSCEILLKIIDSILDYSKLEASALKLEYTVFSVEDIIADCMELLLPIAAKKLDMSYNIEPNVPPWVMADYARIRQVLMNLMGNGLKFTASGYVRVICSVDSLSPSVLPDQAVLKLIIQDTGIGLTPGNVEQLFVPFQQADNSTTRKFGGTGLGLSISRQLVRLMGGDIGVDSQVGVGSTFWFTLPVKVVDNEESRKNIAEVEQLKSKLMATHAPRLLITSTSEATVALLASILSGFDVTTFPTIDEMEGYLRNFDLLHPSVDFIIVDQPSEPEVGQLCNTLESRHLKSLSTTRIIHLYTPTSQTLSRPDIRNTSPRIMKLTKPPRKAKLLQMMTQLKDNPGGHLTPRVPTPSKAVEDSSLARRTLYGNVLVAEDNPVAQQLLVRQLQRFQLNVNATSNGDEAVKEWESHPPGHFSVALFDHHMPICDGIEACKRIRMTETRRKTTTILPIIALSADCQESTKQLCLSAGMNLFLTKPMKKNDLLALLSSF